MMLDLEGPSVAAIGDHPRFEEAMLLSAEAIVTSYGGNWVFNRLVNDRGRMMAALMVLDLHFGDGDGAGFTVGRMRGEAARYGFASPRRVAAWIASLRLLGFLAPATPGRPQRLMPTEKFLALHRDRMRRQWDAIAVIHPDSRRAAAALGDPVFLGRCAQGFIAAYRSGTRLLAPVPEMIPIADRDAGITVLLSLFLAEAAGRSVSIAALARRFKVSRAHVLAVLRQAEGAGLTRRAGPREDYRTGPAFHETVRRFFAALFTINIHAIDTALAAVAYAAPTSPSESRMGTQEAC